MTNDPHTRTDLLAEIEETRKLALGQTRAYRTRDGEERQVAQPDFRAALMASRLKAELTGFLGDGRNMDFETLRAELRSMGYELSSIPRSPARALPPSEGGR